MSANKKRDNSGLVPAPRRSIRLRATATARSVSGPSTAEETMDDPLLLNQTDIWVNNIFPFLGIGNFFFLAQVNRRWKELHQLFFDTIEEPPMVLHLDGYYVQRWLQNKQPARACCTFYGVAFSTLSYAKHWDASTSGCTDRLPDDAVCALVAARGNIQVLQWAREEKGYPWNVKTCNSAARNGQVEALKYALENGCPWPSNFDFGWYAGRYGHLNVLQYAHENGYGVGSGEDAAEGGHLEVVKWFQEVRKIDIHKVGSAAVENGQLKILKWATANGFQQSHVALKRAAASGHIETLKYSHENGCAWNEDTCAAAAKTGQLEVLKYAHENGCPWNEDTCACAAHGHLAVLQYAHENGCPWNEVTCACAAASGDLEIVQYAHENGCPWDEDTCQYAAKNGHLEVLQYAHENGCPWDENTCVAAEENDHFEVLQYALQNGCPED